VEVEVFDDGKRWLGFLSNSWVRSVTNFSFVYMLQCQEAGLGGHFGHPAVVRVEEGRRFATEPAKICLIA